MPEEKDAPSGFKVVDRRSFTGEGKRRESKDEVDPRVPLPAAAAPEPEEYFEEGPAGFDTLVSYLSTTAMFQLGLLPGPSGERIPADLSNAQRTIDLLEVLQQKTQGNLSKAEAKLLEGVLYELRMSYVEVERRQGKKTK